MAIIFSKLLRKTDIEKRLAVPTKHLKSLPSFRGRHTVDFCAMDERTNKVWSFRCTIRKKGLHMKPVLSKDWLTFVSSKKLKVGDKITFFKEWSVVNGTHYKVQAEKEIKIFGSILGCAPGL